MRLHADLILFESALSADHKTLIISVVNPTETAQECEVALSGVHPVGGAKILRLTAPQGTPASAAGFGFGRFSGPPAKLVESSLPQTPDRITLPPASISVYELAVK